MSFSYNPMSKDEAEKSRQFPLLEPGIYNFQVLKAEYRLSNPKFDKKGEPLPRNPMIELILLIWDNNGKEFNVYDYLINSEKMEWKTRHFCDSVGLEKEYEAKQFNEHLCEGRSGKASIIIQAGQKKPNSSEFYKDKNSVEDYLLLSENLETNKSPSAEDSGKPFDDDIDIPF